MKMWSEREVAARLNVVELIGSVEEAFIGLSKGSTCQPPQAVTSLPEGLGDTIYYTGVLADKFLIGVTVSPFIPSLTDQGLSPVSAFTLLLSIKTGQPVMLCDSKLLVAARTGATTMLAVRCLARFTRRVAIIGTGVVAEWHLRCLEVATGCESIAVYSPSINETARSDRRRVLCSLDERVRIAPTLDDAIRQADVVMLCTASAMPVLDPRLLSDSVLVTSVSTDGPLAHEIPPASLSDLDVYCDYQPTTPSVAGEMIIAARDFGWDPGTIIADLPNILASPTSVLAWSDRGRFFRSVGLGIEDIAAASLLL